jgi:hypothetical protein
MKLFAVVLGALALLAGFTGGLRAYSVSATTPPGPPLTVAQHHPVAQAVRPGVHLRWAACRKPAVREGRACVTHVTRTVTLPPPVAAAPPAAPAAPVAHAAPTRVAHSAAPHAEPAHEAEHDHEGEDEHEHEDGGGDD